MRKSSGFGGHEKMSAARVFRDDFSVSGADGPDMTDDDGAADDGRRVVLSELGSIICKLVVATGILSI
jgi:hypothetical protein